MSDTGRTDYQATYRRTERALPLLLAVMAIMAGGVAVIILYVDGRNLETMVFSLAGITVVSLFAVLANTFRVHRWTVEPEGVHVHERPKVPLTGLPRRVVIAFPAIAALRRIESGFDYLIEIVTRDGKRYRMPQAMVANPSGLPSADPEANLDVFAASIRAAAERAGCRLPAATEGLSFWNSVAGLVLLLIMFVLSLAIAGAVAWALWDGLRTTQSRQGQVAAILLLLPFGAGYLLLKSIRRRRAVLAMQQPVSIPARK